MVRKYIQAAMRMARYEVLEDDGSYFGTIPGLQGVWANAETLKDCSEELEEVLEDWILISFQQHLPLPIVDGIDLNGKAAA